MRLLSVELTRLRWRRAVLVLLVGCFLVPVLLLAGLSWNTRPVSEGDRASAQEQLDRDVRSPDLAREIDRCAKHPRQYGVDPADPEAACREMMAPQLEFYLYRPELDVASEREGTGLGVITLLVGLVMLLGTTFAGHDWGSGSMSNQLLFEPRRARVWGAKAAVVFLTGLLAAAVALALFWGGLWLVAGSRDLQATGHQWQLIVHSALRGSLLIALAGVGGYALTMLFRNTVATLGALFAFTIGSSILIVGILGSTATRWLLPTNFYAVLMNGYEYYNGASEGQSCSSGPDGIMECTNMAHLSLGQGATYLGVLLVLATGLSLWSFQRRDVP